MFASETYALIPLFPYSLSFSTYFPFQNPFKSDFKPHPLNQP